MFKHFQEKFIGYRLTNLLQLQEKFIGYRLTNLLQLQEKFIGYRLTKLTDKRIEIATLIQLKLYNNG